MKIAISLILTLVISASALAEPWWQWSDEGWCFRLAEKKTCLPSDYQALRITAEQVEFARVHATEPARFVEYRPVPLRERTKVTLVPDSFVLVSEQTDRDTYIAKYRADAADRDSHNMTVFVIVLNNEVTVLIYGTDDVALSNLARSVVQRWNGRQFEPGPSGTMSFETE